MPIERFQSISGTSWSYIKIQITVYKAHEKKKYKQSQFLYK